MRAQPETDLMKRYASLLGRKPPSSLASPSSLPPSAILQHARMEALLAVSVAIALLTAASAIAEGDTVLPLRVSLRANAPALIKAESVAESCLNTFPAC